METELAIIVRSHGMIVLIERYELNRSGKLWSKGSATRLTA